MTLRTTFFPFTNGKNNSIEKGWIKAGIPPSTLSFFKTYCIGYNKISDSFLTISENAINVTKDFKTILKNFPSFIGGVTPTKVIISDSKGNCNLLDKNNDLFSLSNSEHSLIMPSSYIAENPNTDVLVYGVIGIMAGFSIYGTSNLKSLKQILVNSYSDGVISYIFFNPEDEYIYLSGRQTKSNQNFTYKTKDGVTLENAQIPPIFTNCLTGAHVTYVNKKMIVYGSDGKTNFFRSAHTTFGNYIDIQPPDMKGTLISHFSSNQKVSLLLGQKNVEGKTSATIIYYTLDMKNWSILTLPLDTNDQITDLKYLKDRFIIVTQNNQIFYKIA